MNRLVFVLVLSLALSGCATGPVDLNSVTYTGTVSASSSLAAKVSVATGAVRGSGGSTLLPVGTIFVPISTGPVPRLQFHAEDQRAFSESLRSELVRLGLFKTASDEAGDRADVAINVIFAQTYHNPEQQEYTLDVVMELAGGAMPFLKQYRVVSSENDSFWENMWTNAYEAKAKAAKLLLQKLIPDIEAYIAEGEKGKRRRDVRAVAQW